MSNNLSFRHSPAVAEIQKISVVGEILDTVAALTGLGFVAVAHVTDHSWTTCAVLDNLEFGLKIGDGLDVTTTLCEEVRATGLAIIIDHVSENEKYRNHHTPRIYGFQSYFSIPIFRPGGAYFGTLCGLDPNPAVLSLPATVSTLKLFAALISAQLEVEQVYEQTRRDLLSERETSELREQFIAILGHDLRTPIGAIQHGIALLRMKHSDLASVQTLERMQRSMGRMNGLVDDVVDFTRGRMGGGIALNLRDENLLSESLQQVIDELRGLHPENMIVADIQPNMRVMCDAARLSQLLSNLVKNAIVHGRASMPLLVTARIDDDLFKIEVTNAGKELSPELIEKLFKPFWRVQTRNVHEGLGLGLFIVSEIARSHGGTMKVISLDGEVKFCFSMPHHTKATFTGMEN